MDNPHQFVAVAPDGTTVALGSQGKKILIVDIAGRQMWKALEVKIWEMSTGRPARIPLGHLGAVTGVAFAPDGRRLATCSNNTLLIFDTKTGSELQRWVAHSDSIVPLSGRADRSRGPLCDDSSNRRPQTGPQKAGRSDRYSADPVERHESSHSAAAWLRRGGLSDSATLTGNLLTKAQTIGRNSFSGQSTFKPFRYAAAPHRQRIGDISSPIGGP